MMIRIKKYLINSLLLVSCISLFCPMNDVHAASELFLRGVDISTLQAVEDGGGAYYANGKKLDLLAILKAQGINYVRLRIWNNPTQANNYNNLDDTIRMAKRVKKAGLKVLLDFHYSDYWADPGKQNKPDAWKNLTQPQLEQSVYSYTKQVITQLRIQGAVPDAVQVGNEIAGGMLWPNGKTWGEQSGGFDGLAALLNAGIKGAKDASPNNPQMKIMLHLEEGNNNGKSRWFFDEIKKRNIAFDWIGLSYYPYWNGPLHDLKANMDDLTQRYKKPVIVVETAIGHTLEDPGTIPNIFGLNEANKTTYTVSPDGQRQYLKDLITAVQQVPKNLGIGVFYWEPAWIPTPRGISYATPWNAWKNQALFNYLGEMLPGLTTLGTFNTTAKMLQLASEQLRLTFSKGDATNAVTKNIFLPKVGLYQSSITWKSSLPNVVSNQGVVKRPIKGQPDKVVTLIATVTILNKSTSKSFKLTIKAQK